MHTLFFVLLVFGVYANSWAEQNKTSATVPAAVQQEQPRNEASPAEISRQESAEKKP
mgnify:FL=1